MLRVERKPLPADLKAILDKWQRAVDTQNISLIKPTDITKSVDSLLTEWQKAIDQEQSVRDIPWKVFTATEKQHKAHLLQILGDLFHWKCAYCEMQSELEIEHYIPKSPHPTLNANLGTAKTMFVWDNLLLACKICNSFSFKGASMQWDDDGTPRLLNPCLDDPLYYLHIHLNNVDKKQRGLLTPQTALSSSATRRADYTIARLGLNDREYLAERRYEAIHNFTTWLEMLIKFGAMYEMPSGYTIQQRFLEIFQPTKPFLAPLRQLLATELEIKASLLEQIPELDPLLNQWALPLATPG